MNLSGAWKYAGLLLLVAVYCCSANQPNNLVQRRSPTPLNVTVPINKIKEKLTIVLTKGLDIQLLADTLIQLLTCFAPTTPPNGTTTVLPIPIKLQNELNIKIQNYLTDFTNTIPKENITAYCNSDNFVTIHNFLWKDDLQFRDFIKFLQRFGYEHAYENFRALYDYFECRPGLVEDIKPISSKVRVSSQSQHKPSNIRSQVLSANSSENAFQLTADCNILEMLTNLLQTGILELLQLLETLIEQVNTDPSLQFMIGKLQEPIKGPSFREFRLLTPVRDLLDLMNEAFINEPAISTILDLAKELLGLDLRQTNLLDTILNIVEAILWGNFDPVPPRP